MAVQCAANSQGPFLAIALCVRSIAFSVIIALGVGALRLVAVVFNIAPAKSKSQLSMVERSVQASSMNAHAMLTNALLIVYTNGTCGLFAQRPAELVSKLVAMP
jgi:hypothetical protein